MTTKKSDIIKILITDDNALFRRTLRNFLQLKAGIKVVGEAENGQIAIQKAIELCPDIVLMDVEMAVLGGIKTTSEIRRLCPKVKIIALSSHCDEYYKQKMQAAGASDFVSKDKIKEEIAQAIHNAIAR